MMPHTPFHRESQAERRARERAEALARRQAAMQEGGYGGGQFSTALYEEMGGERVGSASGTAVSGLFSGLFSPQVGKTVEGLKDRGFSDREIKKLFADMDKDPGEYGIKDQKIFTDKNELHRYVMAYVDESSQLYQQTIDTEREMKREEADARLQREFDKAVSEATKPTEEEAGLVAERRRMKAKSQEYVGSKGGVSMQQARKGGAVMIPQRRPM
jgi:hypothetical protein